MTNTRTATIGSPDERIVSIEENFTALFRLLYKLQVLQNNYLILKRIQDDDWISS